MSTFRSLSFSLNHGTLAVGALALMLPWAVNQDVLAQGQGNVIVQTQSAVAIDADPDDGIKFDEEAGGMITLHRRPDTNTLSWKLDAAGFRAGHAYTVWVGNFDDDVMPKNGGWGAGSLVGGTKQLTASGNHCIWPLDTFFDGGFRPGEPPDCDKIDVEKQVLFFVIDHGEWEPGDVMEFWDPTGGDIDEDDATLVPTGVLIIGFGPLVD